MESDRQRRLGPHATHAKGLISSLTPCHDPDAHYQPYDPDLARQQLSGSTYGSGPDLPLLMIDLHRPDMVAMGVAMKEYWKDNLDVDLDILKRESGVPRRESSQFYRNSIGSWIPDPTQIVGVLARMTPFGPFPVPPSATASAATAAQDPKARPEYESRCRHSPQPNRRPR